MVKEGNKAPDFSGKNQNGKPVKLGSFKGRKNVLSKRQVEKRKRLMKHVKGKK